MEETKKYVWLNDLVKQINCIEDYYKILPKIFEMYFSDPNIKKSYLLKHFKEHMFTIYKVNSENLIRFLIERQDFTADMLDNQPKYKSTLELLIQLKQLYCTTINSWNSSIVMPFSISGIEYSINHGSTHHRLRFDRGDGETLNIINDNNQMVLLVMTLISGINQMFANTEFKYESTIINEYKNQLNKSIELLKKFEQSKEK